MQDPVIINLKCIDCPKSVGHVKINKNEFNTMVQHYWMSVMLQCEDCHKVKPRIKGVIS